MGLGVTASLRSYRELAADEMGTVAVAVRKLAGARHPLIATARRMVAEGGDSELRTQSLVLLLVSRILNTSLGTAGVGSDGVLESQRALVEVSEMIGTAFTLHRGVLGKVKTPEESIGNKLSVLGGDFLLANSATALANLRVPEVTRLLSCAIEDAASAHLHPSLNWHQRLQLSQGSLCGHSAQAALHLAALHLAAPRSSLTLLDATQALASNAALALACRSPLQSQAASPAPALVAQEAVQAALDALEQFQPSQASASLTQLLQCVVPELHHPSEI